MWRPITMLICRPRLAFGETVPDTRPVTAHRGCQLYATITSGPAARERLTAVLDAGVVTSVLIQPLPGARLSASEVKPLVDVIQQHNVAALIDGDVQLARTVRADGVHLAHSADCLDVYREARATLGERSIVGADAGRSRHAAMSLAEAGADYISFGVGPSVPTSEDEPETREQLIDWWAGLFEIPCVAFDVVTPEDATTLADRGADFIAFALAPGIAPAAAKAFAETMAEAVAAVTV